MYDHINKTLTDPVPENAEDELTAGPANEPEQKTEKKEEKAEEGYPDTEEKTSEKEQENQPEDIGYDYIPPLRETTAEDLKLYAAILKSHGKKMWAFALVAVYYVVVFLLHMFGIIPVSVTAALIIPVIIGLGIAYMRAKEKDPEE